MTHDLSIYVDTIGNILRKIYFVKPNIFFALKNYLYTILNSLNSQEFYSYLKGYLRTSDNPSFQLKKQGFHYRNVIFKFQVETRYRVHGEDRDLQGLLHQEPGKVDRHHRLQDKQ
jgi:hypothetical protein